MKSNLGNNIKKLGFGFMRIPMVNDICDYDQTNKMVDIFMNNGFTYFDTAYVYLNGESENALKKCLVERYDRNLYQIADKLPIGSNEVKDIDDMNRIFETSLERTNAGYFDFYLLHALNERSAKKAEDRLAWEFILSKKKEGKIKHVGFSFHDNHKVLDDILTKHPEAEFVQLQLNYYDWENEAVESRLCYEVALKHNMPIIIMEPVKGGTLANMSSKASSILTSMDNSVSVASWAIRYAASLDNVVTVLSGMSNIEQMEDNVKSMVNFKPLTNEENNKLKEVVKVINEIPQIGCTDCKYCVDGCPVSIKIPDLIRIMNYHMKFDGDINTPSNRWDFNNNTNNNNLPSACVACGLCERTCPQKIEIIDVLKNITNIYEK